MIHTPTTPRRFIIAALSTLLLAGFVSQSQAQTLPDAAQVAAYAEKLLDEQKLGRDGPGVTVLVARGDQVLYRGARGMASIELGVSLSPDQVFRIGSVTKQFAAATLLKLIDDGRAKLDDPLSQYLPDYPNGKAITLSQLLNHTSGVKSYTGISGYMNNPVRRELSTQELVAEFKNLPVDFAPGASWNYNNSGYVLVGAVIEAISRKAWHEQLQDALLYPQKLSSTAYPGETRLIKGMVNGYGFDPKEGLTTAGMISMTQPHGAGALVSNVDDLWRWNMALHNGKLLSAQSYTRMITPEGPAAATAYGYGITATTLRGQPMLQHGGGIHGFSSSLAYVPQSKISVVVLRNTTGPDFSIDMVSRKLGAFAMGLPYPDIKPVDLSVEQLKAFEGVYSLDAKQTRSLSVKGTQLVSIRGNGRPAPLVPMAGDAFSVVGSMAQIKALRGADGKVTAVQVYQDAVGPFETWTRTSDLPVN
jgi:D-alanyl-D-alanine carboxypeptidase